MNRDERKWSLGLDLPVVGQEVLHFKYPKFGNSITTVSGTFANRLKLDVKSKPKKIELKKFFSMMGELLSMIDSKRLKEGWSMDQSSSNFVLVKELNKNEVFHFEALDASSYYERLNLTLKKKDKFNKLRSVMKMNLFLSQCSGQAE